MSGTKLENLNVASQEPLITPEALKQEMPLSGKAAETVEKGRQAIYDIMDGKDHRLFVVVGPCSIHDVEAAREYAARLKKLADEVSDTLLIVMRVYFEKPRTTVGWKGLINDPHLNDTFDIEQGLHIGRRLLLDISELGLPTATEALDPISPQYLQDTISWSAIGARTTESQTHREMSSGLSMAIGFKNGTDGSLDVAVNAMKSVSHPHSFLGIDQQGKVAVIRTRGNITVTWFFVAAVASLTTTRSALPCVSRRWKNPSSASRSWLIVATPIPARIRPYSHWSCRTLPTRSLRATSPSRV